MAKEDREVQNAIKQIATEHYFFTELKDYLQGLKNTITVANASGKDYNDQYNVQKLFRDQKYIGIAERRFKRYEEHVENILSSITAKTLPVRTEISKALRERLHVEAANLLRDSSRYEGRIYRILVKIKSCLNEKEYATIGNLVNELEEVIDDAEKWIAALSSDLVAARKLIVKYEDHDLVDFTNRHTLASITEQMNKYDFHDIRVLFSGGKVMILSEFGQYLGVQLEVFQTIDIKPMNNLIGISFRVYRHSHPYFDRERYDLSYNPATSRRSFKKVLGSILKIIQETVKYGKTPRVPVSQKVDAVF